MIKNIVQFAVSRRVTVSMLTITCLLFGFISLSKMPITLLPSLEYPTFTIRTEYNNAGPEEIELLITKPIEESVGMVKGVSRLSSVSMTGRSDISLEFNWDADIKRAIYDIRDRLDAVRLPLDVNPPVLLRFNPSTEPVMQFALVSDALNPDINTLRDLRSYADHYLKKKMDPLSGVAAVKISGGYEKQIHILPDQYKLNQFGLSIETISRRLREENINLTGGSIKQSNKLYLVRTVNQFKNIEAIKKLVVKSLNNKPIRIEDIATVSLKYKDRKSINRFDGKEAIEIAIFKEGDANTILVADAVKETIKKLKKDLPDGVSLDTVEDQSIFISSAIDNVKTAALLGGILAVIIIYLFLGNILPTVVIALLIPVSVVTGFFFMHQASVSLNIMSLGGIALAIGLLVDNGIVVLESIAAKKEKSNSVLDAVEEATTEVGSAIFASTLTTVAVFLPLVFVYGIAGQLFKDQAMTVTFMLLVSLVFALLLIPMLSSMSHKKNIYHSASGNIEYKSRTVIGAYLRRTRKFFFNDLIDRLFWIVRKFFQGLAIFFHYLFYPSVSLVNYLYRLLLKLYNRILPWALGNRMLVVFVSFLLFGLTLMLVPRIGINLIPDIDAQKIQLSYNLAEGSNIESTDKVTVKLSEKLNNIPAVKTVYGISGEGGKLDTSASANIENSAQMIITLKPGSDKKQLENTIVNMLNERPGLQVQLKPGQFFDLSVPIEIELSGYDIDALKKAAMKVKNGLSQSHFFINIDEGVKKGNPEIQLIFDQDKIASMGFTVSQIANNIVDKVLGKSNTTVHWNDQKVELLVRAQESQRDSIDDINNLIVYSDDKTELRLSNVADIIVTEGPGEIMRRNQDRVVVVSADISNITLDEAVEEVHEILGDLSLSPLIKVKITGQNKELKASNQSMIFALSLAVFLVYMVLASQFESLLHPLIILISIPLALTGAIWALFLTQTPISVVVFIGMIMLAGIVVNNAIVLIDLIMQLMRKGYLVNQAIIKAGRARLRPIIMTTMTTILGLLPMAISWGDSQAGVEIRAPMAITVIGGLLVATMLTLIVIPVLFSLFNRNTDA